MTPTDDIMKPLSPEDSPLTWRDQRDLSRVSASVRASLVKFKQRPNPPRGVKFSLGVISWEAPQYSEQVTHYRIYAPTEATLVREVPVGQLKLNDNLSADRIFISAFNRNSGLESIKILLDTRVTPIANLRLSMSDFGAVPDGAEGTTGSITATGTTLTIRSTDMLLTQDLVGKPIAIFGAGVACFSDTGHERCAGAHHMTTVVSVAVNGLSCVILAPAINTVSDTQWCAGTDNRPAFSAAIAALRANNGGDLWFDEAGIYLFASSGHTNLFGWYFADLIDFDGCHIHQGEKAKIVCGFPMQFLSINDSVFYNWARVADRPPIARITAPVTEGTILIQCNPADIVAGRYNRDDWVLIFSGYLLDTWVGFEVPDSQICQIVYADTVSGIVILKEPTLKPFVAENYPAPVGWAGPVGAAPFGLINVTDILIHDFRYENWDMDSFFSTFQFYGGQVDGFYLDGVKANLRGGFHAMNYVHGGETSDVRAYIDNLGSPNIPFDYAWTTAVGSSNVHLKRARIDSTGVTYLHLHEGAAKCSVDLLTLGTFSGSPQAVAKTLTGGAITIGATTLAVAAGFVAGDVGKTLQVNGTYTAVIKAYTNATHVTVFPPAPATFAAATVTVGFSINAVHIAGRSYGLTISRSKFIGYDTNAVVHIGADCNAGGLITDCELAGGELSTRLTDVECFGDGWRIDIPSLDETRLYQYSSNLGRPVLRGTEANLTASEGARGLSSAPGGVGQVGSIETFSNDLTNVGFWNAGAGVTRTANSGDILDPIGTNTATKIVTGATSANMEVSKDHTTPAAGLVTGAGNNANRSYVFSFYVYSPIENQMECFVGSFVPGPGLDLTNTEVIRVATYPQWQRVDVIVHCDGAAVTGTEILTGVASAIFAPAVGLSSTFYVWGCTLQEVSELWPLITITAGAVVPYQTAVYSLTGQLLLNGTIVRSGPGSPETVVTAPIGSLYLRINGAAGTVLYLKESGTGNTGWIPYNGVGTTLPVVDTTALVKGSGDATKLVRIEADGLTTATTRVVTMPDRDITLGKVNKLSANSSADLTCTTSPQDITGATITLTETGDYLIFATFYSITQQNSGAFHGTLVVNGATQTDEAISEGASGATTDTLYATSMQHWTYTNSGSNVAKLQGYKAVNAGVTTVVHPHTKITAVFLG